MDRLWSPWRARHVEAAADAARTGHPDGGGGDGRTLFARIAAEPDDEAHGVLWRGAHVYVLLNRFPYTNGHLLVAPYREVADYDALTNAERAELADATAYAIRWLRAALRPDGFNVGMNLGTAGGAGIPNHLHQHVVPRWNGDTNFMPTVADTRVLPESLADTYRRLRAVIGGGPLPSTAPDA